MRLNSQWDCVTKIRIQPGSIKENAIFIAKPVKKSQILSKPLAADTEYKAQI